MSSVILLPLPKPPRNLTRAKPLILFLGYPTSMTQMMGVVLFCLGDVLSLCSVVCCLACTTFVASLLSAGLCTLVVAENLPCVCPCMCVNQHPDTYKLEKRAPAVMKSIDQKLGNAASDCLHLGSGPICLHLGLKIRQCFCGKI